MNEINDIGEQIAEEDENDAETGQADVSRRDATACCVTIGRLHRTAGLATQHRRLRSPLHPKRRRRTKLVRKWAREDPRAGRAGCPLVGPLAAPLASLSPLLFSPLANLFSARTRLATQLTAR